MKKLSDAQLRELEVDLMNTAVRSVLNDWGIGWNNIGATQREGALARAILHYASGRKCPQSLKKWGPLKSLNIGAPICENVLKLCLDRCNSIAHVLDVESVIKSEE